MVNDREGLGHFFSLRPSLYLRQFLFDLFLYVFVSFTFLGCMRERDRERGCVVLCYIMFFHTHI